MEYIVKGKEEGATLHHGGERHGTEGYFIQPSRPLTLIDHFAQLNQSDSKQRSSLMSLLR